MKIIKLFLLFVLILSSKLNSMDATEFKFCKLCCELMEISLDTKKSLKIYIPIKCPYKYDQVATVVKNYFNKNEIDEIEKLIDSKSLKSEFPLSKNPVVIKFFKIGACLDDFIDDNQEVIKELAIEKIKQ